MIANGSTRSGSLRNLDRAMQPNQHCIGEFYPIEQPDISDIVEMLNAHSKLDGCNRIPLFSEFLRLKRQGFEHFFQRQSPLTQAQFVFQELGERPRKHPLREPAPIASSFKNDIPYTQDARDHQQFREDLEVYTTTTLPKWERVCRAVENHNFYIKQDELDYLAPVEFDDRRDPDTGELRERLIRKPAKPRRPHLSDVKYNAFVEKVESLVDHEAYEIARNQHEQKKAQLDERFQDAISTYDRKAQALLRDRYPQHCENCPWVMRQDVRDDSAFRFVLSIFPDFRLFLRTFEPTLSGYRKFLFATWKSGLTSLQLLFEPWYLCVDADLTQISHSFTMGMTRSGKSTLLVARIFQHIKKEQGTTGVWVIDPHRSLALEIARYFRVCKRPADVFFFDPTLDKERIPRLNPFDIGEDRSRENINFMSESLAHALAQICGGEGTVTTNMATLLKISIKLLLSIPGEPKTLMDLLTLMGNDREIISPYLKFADRLNPADQQYLSFPGGGFFSSNIGSSKAAIQARLQAILGNDHFLRITCEYSKSSVDLRKLIGNHAIVIFALGASDIGDDGASALGRLLMAMIVAVGKRHNQMPDIQKRPRMAIFVDEAQHFVSESSEYILTELTKSRKILHLATQMEGQDMPSSFRKAVMANTNFKFIGKSSASQLKLFVEETGLDLDDLKKLRQGRFCFHRAQSLAGTKPFPPRIFRVSDIYFGHDHKANDVLFDAFIEHQLETYYLPDKTETATKTTKSRRPKFFG